MKLSIGDLLTLYIKAHYSLDQLASFRTGQQAPILARIVVDDAAEEERASFGQIGNAVLRCPSNHSLVLDFGQLPVLLEPLDFVGNVGTVGRRDREARQRSIGALPDVEGFNFSLLDRLRLLLAGNERILLQQRRTTTDDYDN